MTPTMTPAPAQLLAWRQREGLTQLELGARLKCRPETVARWERGEWRPSLDHAIQIERLTGISYRSWLDGSPV